MSKSGGRNLAPETEADIVYQAIANHTRRAILEARAKDYLAAIRADELYHRMLEHFAPQGV